MTEPPPAASQAGRKQAAAERAVELVESGMVVGLGSGSTTGFALQPIGALLRDGALRDLVGVPTSAATAIEARQFGIAIVGDDWQGPVDITIDGADEVDLALDLLKGAGGALLREKVVAQASRRAVIVVDETKLSPVLGTRAAEPVEVIAFGWRSQVQLLESLGARVSLRLRPDAATFLTTRATLSSIVPLARCGNRPNLRPLGDIPPAPRSRNDRRRDFFSACTRSSWSARH